MNVAEIQTMLSAARGLSSSETGLPLPPAYYLIFQMSTSSLSFLSSLIIVISIALFGNIGLSTPYRRIIFGLSVSDILQSLALLTGPSSVPASKFSKELANETTSCEANGFILMVGATSVMMYTFFLCLYYLCKLKYRMSDQSFKHKIEKKLHVFIWVFSLTVNIAAVAMDTVHTSPSYRSFCLYASTPTGCGMRPDVVGECDKEIRSKVIIFLNISMVALPAVCFVGIIIIMTILYRHAFIMNQIIEREVSVPTPLRSTKAKEVEVEEEHEYDDKTAQDHESQSPQDRVQHLSRLYRRESMIQATSYVGAFFVTYMPLMIGLPLGLFFLDPPLLIAAAIGIFCWPLGGFLNVLVYTRPKVASLRRSHPECSRLRCFWLVLRAGGEIPDDIESPPSFCECCVVPEWLRSDYEYTTTGDGGEGTKTRSNWIHLSRIGF